MTMSFDRIFRNTMATAIAAIAASLAACGALGQDYPSKPVHVIVPYQAGGRVDLAMRIIGQNLSNQWGQPVIIDNRPGAGGNTGMAQAANAPPDGYTLVSGANPMSANVTLYRNLPFDTLTAFAPITLYYVDANALVVHPSLPVSSVADLVALAKAKPDELTYASSGNGTSLHLSAELFKSMAGVKITHIPYRGVPPAVSDVMGRRVTMMFLGLSIATPYIQSGALKALAVTSEKRFSLLPNLPTLDESGLKGFEASSWAGLLAPAGTPPVIIAKVHRDMVSALNTPEVRSALVKRGFEVVGNSPEEFSAIIKTEIDKWGAIIRATGAKVD